MMVGEAYRARYLVRGIKLLGFSIESPSGFVDGTEEIIHSGLSRAAVEVVWIKVCAQPCKSVFVLFICWGIDNPEYFLVAVYTASIFRWA